jgi:hypothetical protein
MIFAWDDIAKLWDNTPEDKQIKKLADEITKRTLPLTNLVNCTAAFAYPFIPFNPTDLEGLLLDSTGKAFETAASADEKAAAALKAAYKLGQGKGKMKRSTAILLGRAEKLAKFGKAFDGIGYAFALKEGLENLDGCTE